jgi:hypothetical protein
MGKKFTSVYTGISLVLLVATLLFTLGRILSLRRERLDASKAVHGSLRRMMEEGLAQEKSFQSPLLKSSIQQAFQRTPSLMLVIVYSFDEGIHYLRARNSNILTTPLSELDAIRGFPQFHYNSFTHVKITSSLSIPPRTSFLLDAVYLLIDPSELIPIFRDSLILLLLLSGVTLGVYFYGKESGKKIPGPLVATNSGEDARTPTPQPLASESPSLEKEGMEPSDTGTPSTESFPSKEPIESPSIEQCLFSPTTGLGWQPHLGKTPHSRIGTSRLQRTGLEPRVDADTRYGEDRRGLPEGVENHPDFHSFRGSGVRVRTGWCGHRAAQLFSRAVHHNPQRIPEKTRPLHHETILPTSVWSFQQEWKADRRETADPRSGGSAEKSGRYLERLHRGFPFRSSKVQRVYRQEGAFPDLRRS